MSSRLRVLIFGTNAMVLSKKLASLSRDEIERYLATTEDEVAAIIDMMLPDVAITLVDGDTDISDLQAQIAHCRAAALPILALSAAELPECEGALNERIAEFAPVEQIIRRCHSLSRLSRIQRELNRRIDTARDFGAILNKEVLTAGPRVKGRVLIAGTAPGPLRSHLAKLFQIESVDTVADCIDRLYETNVDVVLLVAAEFDKAIPQAAEDIRRDTKYFHMPVVAATVADSKAHLKDVIRAGVTEFLPGNYTVDDVAFSLTNLVRQQHYRMKLVQETRRALQAGTEDSITAVYNLKFLETHLAKHLPRQIALERDVSIGSIAFAVPNRRTLSSTLGTDAPPDALATMVGGLLRNLVRAEDVPARLSNRQFMILMSDTAESDAEIVMRRIRSVLRNTAFYDSGQNSPYDQPQSDQLEVQTRVVAANSDDTADIMLKRAQIQ